MPCNALITLHAIWTLSQSTSRKTYRNEITTISFDDVTVKMSNTPDYFFPSQAPTASYSPTSTEQPTDTPETAVPSAVPSAAPSKSPISIACDGAQFTDENGLVTIQMESGQIVDDDNVGWSLETAIGGYKGEGYLQWTGSNSFNRPGRGLIQYTIRIVTPGEYRFLWRSRIAVGDESSEHNDSWLRFPDADEFYGIKNGSKIYPVGSGLTPNPDGASSDGWFKIYMNRLNSWTWQTRTSDHSPHDVYVAFHSPGVYTMEISARSNGHAIDRIALYDENHSKSDATKSSNAETLCV